MAIGEIAKQLAQQALIDSVAAEPAPAKPDAPGAIMLAQVAAMQRACKEDEELVVLVRTGEESVRVFEFIVPNWQVLVMAGLDAANNTTRIVATPDNVQLVCKVLKAPPGRAPARVAFRLPKS